MSMAPELFVKMHNSENLKTPLLRKITSEISLYKIIRFYALKQIFLKNGDLFKNTVEEGTFLRYTIHRLITQSALTLKKEGGSRMAKAKRFCSIE